MKRTPLALLVTAALCALFAAPLGAQQLDSMVEQELPSLVATYKQLHAAPELSQHEEKTSALVASRLRELGYAVTDHVGKYNEPGLAAYGVVAVLKNGDGPTVYVRTDMDALPVVEQTGKPYASTVKTKNATGEEVGVMHACGHDIHMTTLLGAAKMLAATKNKWHGTLVLIGQPAEEVVKGAAAMLRDGLYERFGKPDYVIAFHDSSSLAAGMISYTPGYVCASADSVDVTIRGMGGHGAAPQSTKDPVVLSAEFILALQTIVSRENSPLDPAVVTVGSIHGGTKRNIIPDEVKLLLTIRTYKPEVRKRVLASLERIARNLALAAGVPENLAPTVTLLDGESCGSTYNDPALTERLAGALKTALGEQNVIKTDPLMVSEDFSLYRLDGKIPTALLQLGAITPSRIASGERLPSLHSSQFWPEPEPTLRTGVKGMTVMVTELMK
jgi:hippurate hydrolase